MRSHSMSRGLALAVASAAALALSGPVLAQGHGHGGGFGRGGSSFHGPAFHGGGGYRGGGYRSGWGGWGWGGLGLGLGVGLGLATVYGPWYADPVVVEPAPVYVQGQPVPALPDAQSAPPAPVIYPRNGQSAQQMDADSNACSEWAGRQPNATRDPSVFGRAVSACMDARGYTLR